MIASTFTSDFSPRQLARPHVPMSALIVWTGMTTLAACAQSSQPWDEADRAGLIEWAPVAQGVDGPPGITLTSPAAIPAGAAEDFVVTEAHPLEAVYFFRGTALGTGPCLSAAGGLCLDIAGGPVFLGESIADDSGTAPLTVTVPATVAPGRDLTVQAIVIRGFGGSYSEKSNATSTTTAGPDHDGDGFAIEEGDCDDFDASRYPGAPEACDDVLDYNCDGLIEPCVHTRCADYFDAGHPTGIYTIDPLGDGEVLEVWCDMSDGGWTLAFVKNSIHSGTLFDNGGLKFGVGEQDAFYLADDPASYSDGSEVRAVAAWTDISRLVWDHLRFTSYELGALTHTTDAIARAELRFEFGNNGYYLWDAPADPPRGDGQTYHWCAGDTEYTDLGIGQVDPPPGAPSDCNHHWGLGSGWDLSFGTGTNNGFTACGGDGNDLMYATWGDGWYEYPAPGAVQAIWVR